MRLRPAFTVSVVILSALACRDAVDPVTGGGNVALDFVFADPGPIRPPGTVGPVLRSRALPPIDQVDVLLSGPLDTAVTLGQTATTFEGTISDLPTGTYEVVALGRGTGLVTYFGRNPTVTVTSGATTTATVTINTFVPELDPVSPTTTEFTQVLSFSPAPAAIAYTVEIARTEAFLQPVSLTTNGNTLVVPVADGGKYFARVRAINAVVAAEESSPSEPVSWEVVPDSTTGSDPGTAFDLGSRSGAVGSYAGFNIFPATDEDWFSITLAAGDVVTATVRTQSLNVSSDLNPTLRFLDAGLNTIATDDDGGQGVESLLMGTTPNSGTYYIVVGSSGSGSVGHYQLDIGHFAPVASVVVDPASVMVTPAATIQLSARGFDALGEELTGREVSWSSEDPSVATVSTAGVVTGVSVGAVGIIANIEGIEGRSDITVSAAALTITPDRDTLTALGEQVQLVATGGVAPVTWSTSDAGIADVDVNTGLVRAIGNGTATITADDGNIQGSAVIVVLQVASSIATTAPIGGLADLLLNPAPTASVLDSNDNVIPNQAITFTVVGGSGDIGGASSLVVLTGPSGIASVNWTLGLSPIQILEVSSSGLTDSITVNAYFGGVGTPTIDGVGAPNEWAGSWCLLGDVAIPDEGQGTTTPGRMCFMNDANNLYILARFVRATDPLSALTASFDANEDGDHTAGDVYSFVVQENGAATVVQDGHWYDESLDPTCPAQQICSADDVVHGGTQDGVFVAGNDGVETVFELSIPLSTGDPFDINVAPGSFIDMYGVLEIFDIATVMTSERTWFPVIGFLRIRIF